MFRRVPAWIIVMSTLIVPVQGSSFEFATSAVPLGAVKVVGDEIFIYSPRDLILTRFSTTGEERTKILLQPAVGNPLGRPTDFAVTPDGSVVFCGITSKSNLAGRPAKTGVISYLLRYDSSGGFKGMYEVSERVEPKRISTDADGNLYILGIGQKLITMRARVKRGAPVSPSIDSDEVVFEVNREGHILRREGTIQIPTTLEEMKSLDNRLDQTPFCIDKRGNKYFQVYDRKLSFVSATGQMRHIPIPSRADIQVISNLLTTPASGMSVVLIEGNNEPRLREHGGVLLTNPVQRTLTFEPGSGFKETTSGPSVPNFVGELSDGRSVSTSYRNGIIKIHVTGN